MNANFESERKFLLKCLPPHPSPPKKLRQQKRDGASDREAATPAGYRTGIEQLNSDKIIFTILRTAFYSGKLQLKTLVPCKLSNLVLKTSVLADQQGYINSFKDIQKPKQEKL